MFKFCELKYERPNLTAAKENTQKYIREFSGAQTYEAAKALFLKHAEENDKIQTAYNIAYIRSTADLTDKFYEGEINFFNEQMPDFRLTETEAEKQLLSSRYLAEFERDFGTDMILNLKASVRLTDKKIIPEQIEEAKLCQKYSKTVAECKTLFKGEERNFYGLLKFMESTNRTERREAFIAWAKLYESVSGELDEIYLQLVNLRKTISQKLGLKSYVEAAYLMNGHFYYGADDIAAFRKQVADEVVPVADKLYGRQRERLNIDRLHYYDEMLVFPDGNASPAGDMRYLLNGAKNMYSAMSKESGEFFEFMLDGELFDLQTRNGKHQGGYCTFLPEYKAPFIFSNFNGTSADVDVLTHEAGHAFQAYLAAKALPLSSQIWATSDVCEIHSMTMEHFAYPYAENFFGENAEKYRYSHLTEAVKTIPYLCLVDHFQHEVFANDFDAQGLRKCWKKLEKIYMPWRDYDGNGFLEGGGFWMQKQHIFLSPFYYIDYALAQICAFEYYIRSKADKDGAWADYIKLCKAGGSRGYFELLKIGGLKSPFARGAVAEVMRGIIPELFEK